MPEHESPLSTELNPQLVYAYSQTFISRRDLYARQITSGSYVCVKQPLEQPLVVAHLHGQITLGAYALDEQSQAWWVCLDADDDEQWDHLVTLARKLYAQEVTSYLEYSRRGGHLWLFTPRLPGHTVRQFGQQLLARYGLDPQIELYPKQDQLKTGPGSLVRLPLGVHRKTNCRYHFIQPDGTPLAPTIRAQLALLAYPMRVPQAFIDRIIGEIKPSSPPPRILTFNTRGVSNDLPLSERLKRRISVLDFVSRYVDLDGHHVGFCPFHDDQHRSFGVNDEENFWHCWAGCGGGSIIDFWMRWREIHGQDPSFVPTITDLAQILL